MPRSDPAAEPRARRPSFRRSRRLLRLLTAALLPGVAACAPGESPSEPRPEAAPAAPVDPCGRWVLDHEEWMRQALAAYREQAKLDELDESARAAALVLARERLSAHRSSLRCDPDGRFRLETTGDGGVRAAVLGTWEREGDLLVLVGAAQHEGAKPQRREGVLQGDRLEFPATPSEPRALYLRAD